MLFSVLSGKFTGIIITDATVNSHSVLIIKSLLHLYFCKYLIYKFLCVQRDAKMLQSATLPLCLWLLNKCSIKVRQCCFAFAIIIKLQIQLRKPHTENTILDSYINQWLTATNLQPFLARRSFFHAAFLILLWPLHIHNMTVKNILWIPLQCVAGSEIIEPCSCYSTRHSPNGDRFSVWQVNLWRLMARGSLCSWCSCSFLTLLLCCLHLWASWGTHTDAPTMHIQPCKPLHAGTVYYTRWGISYLAATCPPLASVSLRLSMNSDQVDAAFPINFPWDPLGYNCDSRCRL